MIIDNNKFYENNKNIRSFWEPNCRKFPAGNNLGTGMHFLFARGNPQPKQRANIRWEREFFWRQS
jgi:hypothetical protein